MGKSDGYDLFVLFDPLTAFPHNITSPPPSFRLLSLDSTSMKKIETTNNTQERRIRTRRNRATKKGGRRMSSLLVAALGVWMWQIAYLSFAAADETR